MNLKTCLLTNNDCYKAGSTIAPRGIMVHSTGCNNPNISRYVPIGESYSSNHWNKPKVYKCVHAFIGKLDGTVATCQTLPWEHRAWHCASGANGSANNTHISFEICEDTLKDKAYFSKVYREAVELTAMLCVEYNLDPMEDGVVICHSEGYNRGVASNHSDVMHWFTKFGVDMDTFREDVKFEIEELEENDMTQEQFDAMMNVWLSSRDALEESKWAKNANVLARAVDEKISDGTRPRSLATREEVMAMVLAGRENNDV